MSSFNFKKHFFIYSIIIFSNTCSIAVEPSDTVIAILMAARNDLWPFAGRNIKQMQSGGGSNKRIKIIAQLDMIKSGKNISKRLLIEEKKILQIGPDLSLDSGDSKTLIDFLKFTKKLFPSKKLILELWNHGTGIIEPALKTAVNPSDLFSYNHKTKKIELNRSIGFLDYVTSLSNLGIKKEEFVLMTALEIT